MSIYNLSKQDLIVIDGTIYRYNRERRCLVKVPICDDVVEPKLGTGDDPK